MNLITVLRTFFSDTSERRNKQMFCDYIPTQIDWDIHRIRLISISRLQQDQMTQLVTRLSKLVGRNLAIGWTTYQRTTSSGQQNARLMIYYCVEQMPSVTLDQKHNKLDKVDDEYVAHSITSITKEFSSALVLWNCLEQTTDDGEDHKVLERSIRQIADILVPPDAKIIKLGYTHLSKKPTIRIKQSSG